MKHKIIIVLFLFTFLLVLNSSAFEIDMFRSGMSKTQVKSLLKHYATVEEKEDNIFAIENSFSRFYSFNFCNEKLVMVKKDLNPSIKELIILFDKLTNNYGKPIHLNTKINKLCTKNTQHAISFYWKSGIERISLDYSVFPENEQFSVTYEIENTCDCDCF
jgi:hypothetical protein